MININQEIINKIEEYILISSSDSLNLSNEQKAWNKPVIGFSNASDDLYFQIKEQIGSDYLLPNEFFQKSYPGYQVNLKEINVITWILPKAKNVKTDNRKENRIPSEKWIRAKKYGEDCNKSLMQYIIRFLQNKGFKAFAPVLSEYYNSKIKGKNGNYASWSERHTAYIAGQGTFGLCDGLITEVGKAVRIGSIITNAPIVPSQRKYKTYNEYCLFYKNNSCFHCIKRCPAGAISEKGHDKNICREYIASHKAEYKTKYNLNFDEMACGLCQTKVPCESKIPVFKQNL